MRQATLATRLCAKEGRARVGVGSESASWAVWSRATRQGDGLLGGNARPASVVADQPAVRSAHRPFVEDGVARICARADGDDGVPAHRRGRTVNAGGDGDGAFGDVRCVATPTASACRLHAPWVRPRPAGRLGRALRRRRAAGRARAGRAAPAARPAQARRGRSTDAASARPHPCCTPRTLSKALHARPTSTSTRAAGPSSRSLARRGAWTGRARLHPDRFGPTRAEQLWGRAGRGADLWGLGCLRYSRRLDRAPFASFAGASTAPTTPRLPRSCARPSRRLAVPAGARGVPRGADCRGRLPPNVPAESRRPAGRAVSAGTCLRTRGWRAGLNVNLNGVHPRPGGRGRRLARAAGP